jgi:hypothetical protein
MKLALKILLFVVLFTGVVFAQFFFDLEKSKAKYFEPNVLAADKIKMIDLGLDNAASDLIWLAAIQYVGGTESKTLEKLGDYLFTVVELDPKFSYPYAFGVLLMPAFNQTDRAIELANLGLQNSEPDWRIPYYLAATYHWEKDDPAMAAKYFDLAANTKGAPANIKWVAANYGSGADKRERTKNIWIGIMTTSSDEVVKERAKNYIIHYEIMDLLEQAAKIYQSRYKKYPQNLEDLVSAYILKAIPSDPFGFQFKIDSNGQVTAN